MIDSIEDLLLATLDAVSRFRVGQREAVGAALEAGGGRGKKETGKGQERDTPPMEGLEYAQRLGKPRRRA